MDSTITRLANGATFIFAEHPSPAYAVMTVMQTGHLDGFETRHPYFSQVTPIGDVTDTQVTMADELAAFHAEQYCGSKLVILCAGPRYPDGLVSAMAEALASIPVGQSPATHVFAAHPAEGSHTPERFQENDLELVLPLGLQDCPGQRPVVSLPPSISTISGRAMSQRKRVPTQLD